MSLKSPLLVLCAILLFQTAAGSPFESKPRKAKATLDLYEFVNPALEKQLAQIADSCFSDDADFLILSLFPQRTLYADLPDIDPEQGAPCNALLETYHSYYNGYECGQRFFSRITSCVKIGKRLCLLEDTVPGILRRTGQRITEQHPASDFVCICAEEERYLLLGSDALVQRVYPIFCLVPDGPIDTILFTLPNQPPQFPNGDVALSRWIALRIQWPDNLPLVLATFTVELDGSVSDIQAPPSVKDTSKRAFVESLRPIIPSMPRWTPGKIYGKTVRSSSSFWLKRP